jgi:hypothetical protein
MSFCATSSQTLTLPLPWPEERIAGQSAAMICADARDAEEGRAASKFCLPVWF